MIQLHQQLPSEKFELGQTKSEKHWRDHRQILLPLSLGH
jgi:hypothetical protein